MRQWNLPGFRYVDSCVDYRSFVAQLNSAMTHVAHNFLTEKLQPFGVAERERMGVTYIRGAWGFLVIPGLGFPELRVSFYHDTPDREVEAVLVSIWKSMEESHRLSSVIGDENE